MMNTTQRLIAWAALTLYHGVTWDELPERFDYWNERVQAMARMCGYSSLQDLNDKADIVPLHVGWDNQLPKHVWLAIRNVVMERITWCFQPEGHEYWMQFYTKLSLYADGADVAALAMNEAFKVIKPKSPKKLSATGMIAFLTKRGYYIVGTGAYSTVMAHDSDPDHVIKVSRTYDDWPVYVQWAEENGYAGTFAPKVKALKVYNAGTHGQFYVAKVERLAETVREADSPDVNEARDELENVICGYIDEPRTKLAKLLYETRVNYFADRYPGMYEFAKAFKKRFRGGFDLHKGNFMVDENHKRVVLTDPLTDQGHSTGKAPVRIKSTEPVFAATPTLAMAA
jgi:hypothetical protein